MKEYLKMSDVFKGELFIDCDCDDVIVDDLSLTVLESFSGSDAAKFALHAINSHDELVEMNNELLDALEGVIDYLTFDGFGGRFNSIREDVDLTDGLKKFMGVIAKAKGEQQSQPNALRDDVYVAGGKA